MGLDDGVDETEGIWPGGRDGRPELISEMRLAELGVGVGSCVAVAFFPMSPEPCGGAVDGGWAGWARVEVAGVAHGEVRSVEFITVAADEMEMEVVV